MNCNWYELSILKMKDKYVVMSTECGFFGMFKFTNGICPDFKNVMAIDCTSNEVYNRCGVSTKQQAEVIINGYHDYLVLCGNTVKIK